MISNKTICELWEEFTDIPCDDYGNTEESFLGFDVGTNREEIWHWFDRYIPVHRLLYEFDDVKRECTRYGVVAKVLGLIEDRGFLIHEYTEHDKLCGYELESWTNGGVDMGEFIDLRHYEDGITAENIAEELRKADNCFDIDEEIDIHRQDSRYRAAFSISESVHDFEDYAQTLHKLSIAVNELLNGSDKED